MNLFSDYGYNQDEIKARVNSVFKTLFEGADDERIYFEDKDGGYILDTGNNDIRSEGMGFGMMIAVQMDRKDIFDKLWSWAKKHHYIDSGECKGYFHFSCNTDGSVKMELPRPDGEEFISMALFFAGHRWGNADGIFNYDAEAKAILDTALHSANPLWNKGNFLIRNLIGSDATDIAYNMPHFYEWYSMFDDPKNSDFWKKAAGASRAFIVRAANKKTGMTAEYTNSQCEPLPENQHGTFFSHSYFAALNIGLYTLWFGDTPEYATIAKNLIAFFDGKKTDEFMDYKIDGTPGSKKALHPIGLAAGLGAVSMALERSKEPYEDETMQKARRAVQRFWETPLRKDNRRYYDNSLYMFALLALSGQYKVY